MSEQRKANTKGKPVCVVIGATSKWQSDGRNTLLAHGHAVDDSDVEIGIRWGVGGAIAQKFASEGFFTVVTTRKEANATALAAAVRGQGGDGMIVELDLVSKDSIASAFATIRREAGDPEVLVYNAGYLEGRDLPPEKELLEHVPVEMLDTGLHISARGPFLVAQEVLPAMRKKGSGSFFFSNNSSSLRGKKRMTGQSLYYPAGLDAHLGAGIDRGIFRARRARRQHRHRRLDRLARQPQAAAQREPARPDHQPDQDRRGLLVPAHPGPLVLDARAPADAIRQQAELLSYWVIDGGRLTPRRRGAFPAARRGLQR